MKKHEIIPKELIDIQEILPKIINLPVVKVDRAKFLRKELKLYYPDSLIEDAIIYSPAYAGIPLHVINKLANAAINYEATKVSSLSFAAGLPGGWAMVCAIPADTTQYFVFILRILQKLAYLYSFPDFDLKENNINEETLNQLIIFIGVMMGAEGASSALKKLADIFSKKVAKSLAQKALTKGTVYPLVKKIATSIGVKMTKQIFADSIGKVVTGIGGVVCGGLSLVTFIPCAKRLQKNLKTLPICDPDHYEHA